MWTRVKRKKHQVLSFMSTSIFILFLLTLLFGQRNTDLVTTTSNSKNDKVTYYQKQDILINGEYKYRYRVNSQKEIIYSGTCHNSECEGFKEDTNEVIKYRTTKDNVYIFRHGEYSTYDKLYEGLNEKFFDFKYLFNMLNKAKVRIDTNKDYIYDNINGYQVLVKTNDKKITEIIIKNDLINYEFLFEYYN